MSTDKTNRDEPLSLHGLTPEDAIRKMFNTPESKTVICPTCGEHPVSGLGLIDEEGNIRCPNCGLIATYKNQT
jgi:hypothetical protein